MKRSATPLPPRLCGIVMVVCLLLVTSPRLSPSFAQEGHPLTGTWSGDWGPSVTERRHITMVMAWDGKAVTGTINPGPDAVPVDAIHLDVTSWTLRFEAKSKDASGAAAAIAVEGKLDDLASYHRTITGTWQQGSVKGDFKLTRD